MIGREAPSEESVAAGLARPPFSSLSQQIEAAAREQVIFNSGRQDYRKKIPLADCPYAAGSTEASLWAQGYGEARDADERRRY